MHEQNFIEAFQRAWGMGIAEGASCVSFPTEVGDLLSVHTNFFSFPSRYFRCQSCSHVLVPRYVFWFIKSAGPIAFRSQVTVLRVEKSSNTNMSLGSLSINNVHCYGGEKKANLSTGEQKIILMRVGFEPTPFRTSDCSVVP